VGSPGDAETGAGVRRHEGDVAAVRSEDVGCDGEAHARSAGIAAGREEGVEDARGVAAGDAGAVVVHLERCLVVGLAGGVALSEGFKGVFERERPPAQYQAVDTINASFPSGHALLSTVFYLTVGVMLARVLPSKRLKVWVMVMAVTIAMLVGLSRVYLGAHWATDVFAGWSLGAAWAMALWLAAHLIERFQRRHHAPLQDEPAPE